MGGDGEIEVYESVRVVDFGSGVGWGGGSRGGVLRVGVSWDGGRGGGGGGGGVRFDLIGMEKFL